MKNTNTNLFWGAVLVGIFTFIVFTMANAYHLNNAKIELLKEAHAKEIENTLEELEYNHNAYCDSLYFRMDLEDKEQTLIDNWCDIEQTSNRIKSIKEWLYQIDETNSPTRFFTDYDLWDPNQNDSTPCISASGKDVCELTKQWIQTIALVNIKRWELWIEFWDEVALSWWPCAWIYRVEDEMNFRFRQAKPIYRPWTNYEIRGDIARFNSNKSCGWAYTITKI